MNRLVTFFIAVLLLFSTFSVCAQENEISVYMNNEKVEFDVEPIIINGRTMVPLRKIFEKLGAEVEWYGETNTVMATKNREMVAFIIGSPYMETSRKKVALDVPAMIINGRTLVPLRAVSEAYNCDVEWLSDTRTVQIYTEDFVDFSKVTEEATIVEVSTTEELLNAIGSNKKIILTNEHYDLSEVENVDNPYLEAQAHGSSYQITGVVNMMIEGNAEIEVDDIYAEVLRFKNCGKIVLDGLTVGHKEPKESYMCEGAVIGMQFCENMTIRNCKLYGCGAHGVYSDGTLNLSVEKTDIYDCTRTGVLLNNSEVEVIESNFYDCTYCWGGGLSLAYDSIVEFKNCYINNIVCGTDFIEASSYSGGESTVTLDGCTIENTEFENIVSQDSRNVFFKNCTLKNNKGNIECENVIFTDCNISDNK